MNELLEILRSVNPSVDFASAENLVTGGVISSFEILQIVMEIEEHFGIEIASEQIDPANFNSAAALMALIEKNRG